MIRWAKEIREVVLSFFLGSVVVGIISWKERIDRYFSNICVWHCLGYLCNICAQHLDICAIFVLASGLLLLSAINNWNNFDFVVSLHKWSNTAKQRKTNGATPQNKETQM